MAQHGRIGHSELIKSLHEASRLSCSGPDPRAWPLAIPEAWPIEAQDTIGPSKKINKPVDGEILDHGSIAMEQHDARSGTITTVDIVESHAVALDEDAGWRVPPFRKVENTTLPNTRTINSKAAMSKTVSEVVIIGPQTRALYTESQLAENVSLFARNNWKLTHWFLMRWRVITGRLTLPNKLRQLHCSIPSSISQNPNGRGATL